MTTPAADRALVIIEARRLAASGAGKMIREAAGLSLAEVGLAVDADPSTIFRWETGERRPSSQKAVDYLDFLERLRETYSTPRRRVAA